MNTKNILSRSIIVTGLICPSLALAQPPGNFSELVVVLIEVANPLFILIVSLSFFVFLWGLTRVIFSLGGEEGVAQGKTIMLWGVIALFLSVAFWGVVNIFYNTIFG